VQAKKQAEHERELKLKGLVGREKGAGGGLLLSPRGAGSRLTRSQSGARRSHSPGTRSSSKNGRARTGAVRCVTFRVWDPRPSPADPDPDPGYEIFSDPDLGLDFSKSLCFHVKR